MHSVDSLPARIRVKFTVTDGCWPWTASKSHGYGKVAWQGESCEAHRVIYELLVGPIPAGHDLDHDCHNDDPDCPGGECAHRGCQNPEHMTPRLRGANVLGGKSHPAANARKTHCDAGHEYTPATMVMDGGTRRCLICRRATDHRRRPRGVEVPGRVKNRQLKFRGREPSAESRAEDAKILELRASGMSFRAIATELGIANSFVYKRYRLLTD
jgi:hypothetical protein